MPAKRVRKRDNHRAADYKRDGDEESRINGSARWRRGEIDHRDRILRHVGREESPEIALIHRHGIDFFQIRPCHAASFFLDQDLVDSGRRF